MYKQYPYRPPIIFLLPGIFFIAFTGYAIYTLYMRSETRILLWLSTLIYAGMGSALIWEYFRSQNQKITLTDEYIQIPGWNASYRLYYKEVAKLELDGLFNPSVKLDYRNAPFGINRFWLKRDDFKAIKQALIQKIPTSS